MEINQAKNFILRWYAWLAEEPALCTAVTTILFAIILSFYCGTEDCFLFIGAVLQLLGMWLTINGVWGIIKYFPEKDPPWKSFTGWLKRWPGAKSTIRASGNLVFSGQGGVERSSHGTWEDIAPDMPVDLQLKKMVLNVNRLKEIQGIQEGLIYKLADDQTRDRKTAKDELKILEDSIQKKRVEMHTGDWAWSVVGLSWLTTGMLLTFIGPVLAQ